MGGNFDHCDLHQPTFNIQSFDNTSPSATIRQQPQPASYPPFLLFLSLGPAADYRASMLGLYRKTEEMFGGCSVYMQEHDNTKYGGIPCKLFRNRGIWKINEDGDVCLMAATASESPTSSIIWRYQSESGIWRDDPALTVKGLNEKPRSCEILFILSKDIAKQIMEPGADGLYREDGSYCRGRPVLQHEGGRFTLIVDGEHWKVYSRAGSVMHLQSGSAPSQCPAHPRAATNDRERQTEWTFRNKWDEWLWPVPLAIRLYCNTHRINSTNPYNNLQGVPEKILLCFGGP